MDKLKNKARIAKLKMTGVKGWIRRHLAFTIVLAVVLIAFIGSLIFTATFYRDKAAPGVTVADAKIGGQTREQIIDTIDNLVGNMQLSLTYGGKSATASATDLGINIDAAKIADEAIQTGRQNPFAIILDRRHFDLTGSYDQAKVNAFVSENFPELSTDSKDAQVVYDSNQNKFVVQPGAIGKSVKLDILYAQVEKLLSSPKLTNYEIAVNDDNPTVNDQSAQAVADHVNSVLAQTIQVINNGRVLWTLDPWDIASWVSFSANPDTSSYDINYDQNKIKDFVNGTVAAQLTNKPVNQKAITNASGTVLKVVSAGRNGQVASNVDSITSQIYDMLVNNQGGQVEMITKDAPYGTDATVSADGRWIEYNISTYTVTLYEGANAVWSTNQTSNGKASTPTITGLYSVWRKTYNQCMPNPPSPEPLCNIHYVTYWEKSGYAFHEAWWMTYAAGNVRAGISHGCVNMFQADAKRVYDFASIGTPVWVHY